MNIGSLYRVKKYYWILFPSKERLDRRHRRIAFDHAATAGLVGGLAAYYSQEYKENVTYFSPDSYIVFLEEDGNLRKVLTSDGLIGWTWFVESYNDCFEEVKSE